MSYRMINGLLLSSLLCFAMSFLGGCGLETKPPNLTQTVSVGPNASIKFPGTPKKTSDKQTQTEIMRVVEINVETMTLKRGPFIYEVYYIYTEEGHKLDSLGITLREFKRNSIRSRSFCVMKSDF